MTGLRLFSGADKESMRKSFDLGEYFLPNAIGLSSEGVKFLEKCLQRGNGES